MDAEQKKALLGSIEKWRGIVERKGIDKGTDNCPLCELNYKNDCDGCPVSKYADFPGCHFTPYNPWCEHHEEVHDQFNFFVVVCPECERLARDQLAFLESLLPEEKEEAPC